MIERFSLNRTDFACLIGISLIVVCLGYGLGQFVLQDFPNSADEHAYLFQAQLFAQGQLTAQSHPQQEFLSPFYILDRDEKVFSLFPPGWPLALSLGVRLGTPGLVNPIIGGLTIPVLFAIALMLWGKRGAWMAVGILVFCPFFLFNSASFFSHPACLFGVMLTVLFLMLWDRSEYAVYAVFAGLAASWTFTVREYTAVLILAVPIFAVLRGALNKRLYLLCFLAGCLPFLFFYLYNNQCTTGHWWEPARFLQSSERLGFGEREIHVFDYVEIQQYGFVDGISNLLRNCGKLFLWTLPGLPLYALLGGWKNEKNRWLFYFALSSAMLPLGYLLYPSDGGNQYGPRFYYESLAFLSLLAVPAVEYFLQKTLSQRVVTIVFSVILIGAAVQYGVFGRFYYEQINDRRTLYRLVEMRDLHKAIVFVAAPSGDMTQGDLIRNSTEPQKADVIYAWHLGKRNRELADCFPHRTYYIFGRNTRSGLVYLERLSL